VALEQRSPRSHELSPTTTTAALGNTVPGIQSPDTTPPEVVLTHPVDGIVLAASELLTAMASDNNGRASRVEFWIDTTLHATTTTPPYQYTLDTTPLPRGTHTITAKAYDAAGNSSSYAVTVTR
jgi:hypothetical protein